MSEKRETKRPRNLNFYDSTWEQFVKYTKKHKISISNFLEKVGLDHIRKEK